MSIFEIEIHGGKQGLYFEVTADTAGFIRHSEPKLQAPFIIRHRSSKPLGPSVITHEGNRYHVRGGIRGPLFITLGNHIK